MNVRKPIFIIGVGRSGSTAFHHLLARHPNLAWLSNLCDKFPANLRLHRTYMQMVDMPQIGTLLQQRIFPDEAYFFWNYHCKGFARSCRDLFPEDVTPVTRKHVRQVLAAVLTPRRHRLLIKITGWSRMGFLQAIFPDAKFIHILRDARAVVNSLINVPWWQGWKGPQGLHRGELTPEQRAEWDHFDQSFIALAGIEFKVLIDAISQARHYVDERNYTEVRYEDLCADPVRSLHRLTDFCELDWSHQFEQTVRAFPLHNNNYKWQRDLTQQQQTILEAVVRDYTLMYGYEQPASRITHQQPAISTLAGR